MNNSSTVPDRLTVQSSVASPPLPLPTLSAEKGVVKKPETPLDNDDSFRFSISPSKLLNDSSTVPDSLVVQSSVATSPLPITFPTLNAEKRDETKPLDTDDSLPVSPLKFLNDSSDYSSTVPDSLFVRSSVATSPLHLTIRFPTLKPQTNSANSSFLSPTPTFFFFNYLLALKAGQHFIWFFLCTSNIQTDI